MGINVAGGMFGSAETWNGGVQGVTGEFTGSQATGVFYKAGGGLISGPGTGTSDSIPAMLSNGEFVVNSAATAQHRNLLEAINGGAWPARFASGGFVGEADAGLWSGTADSGATLSNAFEPRASGDGGGDVYITQHINVDSRQIRPPSSRRCMWRRKRLCGRSRLTCGGAGRRRNLQEGVMAIVNWPAILVPAKVTWGLQSNTETFTSPLNRSTQTLERPSGALEGVAGDAANGPGHTWSARSIPGVVGGMAGRFRLWPHARPVSAIGVGASDYGVALDFVSQSYQAQGSPMVSAALSNYKMLPTTSGQPARAC